MSYYVILRGPLGVGKTTVARRVARALSAELLSIDRILEEQGFWYQGRLSEFLKANRVAAGRARPILRRGRAVVFDGNFYWKTQIEDLERRLPFAHVLFTLQAPLRVCVARDAGRPAPHGSAAARIVYARSTRFAAGLGIDTTPPLPRVVSALLRRLRREIPAARPPPNA